MFKLLLQVLTYVFALYGFLMFLLDTAAVVLRRLNINIPGIRLAIIVKDREEVIEGVVRSILMTSPFKRFLPGQKLYIIDMDSKDDTSAILSKLSSDCGNIEILDESEKEKIFKGYDKKYDIL